MGHSSEYPPRPCTKHPAGRVPEGWQQRAPELEGALSSNWALPGRAVHLAGLGGRRGQRLDTVFTAITHVTGTSQRTDRPAPSLHQPQDTRGKGSWRSCPMGNGGSRSVGVKWGRAWAPPGGSANSALTRTAEIGEQHSGRAVSSLVQSGVLSRHPIRCPEPTRSNP